MHYLQTIEQHDVRVFPRQLWIWCNLICAQNIYMILNSLTLLNISLDKSSIYRLFSVERKNTYIQYIFCKFKCSTMQPAAHIANHIR